MHSFGSGTDDVLANSNLWDGFNAAGAGRANPGPNRAGAPRSINNT